MLDSSDPDQTAHITVRRLGNRITLLTLASFSGPLSAVPCPPLESHDAREGWLGSRKAQAIVWAIDAQVLYAKKVRARSDEMGKHIHGDV